MTDVCISSAAYKLSLNKTLNLKYNKYQLFLFLIVTKFFKIKKKHLPLIFIKDYLYRL